MLGRRILGGLATSARKVAAPAAKHQMVQMCFFSRISGTVKFFDSVKGFGFIAPSDATEDVFVHQSNIKTQGFRSLSDGEEVEFVVEENADTGKRYAVEVTGPGGAPPKGAPRKGDLFGGERKPRNDRDGGRPRERY